MKKRKFLQPSYRILCLKIPTTWRKVLWTKN
ncbi:unnamed protein product [Nezara viridula]|uniref:Uncharacterized protein n=1 Tax=Nezara viridula TaxID=85310 RepID=A0A9P0HGN7_NEZVI|nr:unnamed protein product [Nezara viridula]